MWLLLHLAANMQRCKMKGKVTEPCNGNIGHQSYLDSERDGAILKSNFPSLSRALFLCFDAGELLGGSVNLFSLEFTFINCLAYFSGVDLFA